MKGMIRMRDKNLSYIQFLEQFRQQNEEKSSYLSKMLRTAVVDNPTFPEEYFLRLPRDYSNTRNLAVCHYYLPEKLKWEIFLNLSDSKFSHFNSKQRIELKIILSSKENCEKYFYLSDRYSSHEVFGNILGQIPKIPIKIIKRNLKVKYPKRKRGYHDKGSLRPRDKWLETSDWSLTELQNEKERKLYLQNKSINRILSYLRNCYLD